MKLHTQLSQAGRYGHTLDVALIDLDGLKGVNDTLGHNKGYRLPEALQSASPPRCQKGTAVPDWEEMSTRFGWPTQAQTSCKRCSTTWKPSEAP